VEDPCPKCGAPGGGESCPKCGLIFARYIPDALEEGVDQEVVRLWRHVEARWEDRAGHALFVEQCILFGDVGYAAACYRRRGDDPVAKEQLARLAARLDQSLAASAADRSRPAAGRTLSVLLMILILLAAAGLAMYILAR